MFLNLQSKWRTPISSPDHKLWQQKQQTQCWEGYNWLFFASISSRTEASDKKAKDVPSTISHNSRVSGLKEGWSYWKYGVLWTVGECEEVEITTMLRRRKRKENQWKGLSCIKWMFDGKIRRHFILSLVQLLPLDTEISLCNKNHYRKNTEKESARDPVVHNLQRSFCT